MKKTQAAPDFASRFRALRRLAGLTQPQLAERLGVSQQAISKIETGVVPVPGGPTRILFEMIELNHAVRAAPKRRRKR